MEKKEKESRPEWDRLLLLMGTGDREAFRQLYEETARFVYGYALSILKHPEDAEEVMQDTYLAVWEKARQYEPEGKPLAWIFTIARNLCYMRLRRKNGERGVSLEGLLLEEPGLEPGALCRQIEEAPEKQALLQALSFLEEKERQIVLLHDAGGLKHREIAENLGTPLPTVLSKYRRALKKLEKRLAVS